MNVGHHGAIWQTKAGLLVRQHGDAVNMNGVVKIHAYRTLTSGYHGLLRVDRLVFVGAKL